MASWQNQINNNISEPAEIHGLANGQLPSTVLSDIKDKFGNVVGQLCHTAARAWTAMIAAAAKDNVAISARDPGVPPSSTYRSLPEQQGLWNDNYTTTPTKNGGRTCGGQYRYLRDGKNVAACPGTSNHGRGLAIDSNVEVDGVLSWLEAHSKTFGFQWEISSEAWHIHYYTGDTIPQEVLNFEGHGNVQGDEEEMKMYQIVGKHADSIHIWLVNGNDRFAVPNMDYVNTAKADGITLVAVNPSTWDLIRNVTTQVGPA